MKRPPGLWLLLSAGVLWLSMQDVYGIRATALIFGRGPTTSTTTTELPSNNEEEVNNKTNVNSNTSSQNSTTSSSNSTTNTTRVLTGIPQIDYIYDPNLPRELNGYNLSEYPFYDRVPKDIVFKCDGLHDGFYASIPHKCQVYHHCLFGTRYDFLCANYTAFDQKTFICHFVSEVDCNNSPKFWHRNDALYQAASTTTPKPPPPPSTTTTQPPPPIDIGRPLNSGGGRRRKPLRRRPQYEYYDEDEDYEEEYYEPPPPRQRGRRKRPRPRPRPVYEDEYEDYEDERYERRGSAKRGGDRDRRPYDEDRYSKKRPSDDRRYKEEEDIEERKPIRNDDRRSDKRKNVEERNSEPPKRTDKVPAEVDYYEDEASSRRANLRPKKNKHLDDEEELPLEDKDEKPIVKPVSGSSIYGQPRKAPRIKPPVPKNEQNKYNYKVTNTVKSTTLPPPKNANDDEEYYEDEEEELPPPRPTPRSKGRPNSGNSNASKRPVTSTNKPVLERSESKLNTKTYGFRPRGGNRRPVDEVVEEDIEELEEEKPKPRRPYRTRTNSRKNESKKTTSTTEDYEVPEDEDERQTANNQQNRKPVRKQSATNIDVTESVRAPAKTKETEAATKSTETNSDVSSTKTNFEKGYVRVVKRPFLPSRGGNPYAARGLKPVGAKALDEETFKQAKEYTEHKNSEVSEDSSSTTTLNDKETKYETSGPEKSAKIDESVPKQIMQGSNSEPSEDESYEESEEGKNETPVVNNDPSIIKSKFADVSGTTVKPYFEKNSPLRIPDDEYDVTLNEAISPTIPNLPIRSYPAQNFAYNTLQQRQRVNQQYKPTYQLRPTNHGTIIIPNEDSSNVYYTTGNGYNPNLDEQTQVYRSQNFRSNPQVTQVRTQPFYAY